jgi:hypothetical protein
MTKFIYGKVNQIGWFEVNQPVRPLGVLVRQSSGGYMTEPRDLSPLLIQAIEKLSVQVAFTIATDTTEAIFDVIRENDHNIMLGDGIQLQIVDSLKDITQAGLSRNGTSQRAALLKTERILLVWHDDVDKVLLQAAKVEEKLLRVVSFIWAEECQSSCQIVKSLLTLYLARFGERALLLLCHTHLSKTCRKPIKPIT